MFTKAYEEMTRLVMERTEADEEERLLLHLRGEYRCIRWQRSRPTKLCQVTLGTLCIEDYFAFLRRQYAKSGPQQSFIALADADMNMQ